MGTCPNIKVELDVVDKIPFIIRLYDVKKDKDLDKEMKRPCHLGILKESFSLFQSSCVN